MIFLQTIRSPKARSGEEFPGGCVEIQIEGFRKRTAEELENYDRILRGAEIIKQKEEEETQKEELKLLEKLKRKYKNTPSIEDSVKEIFKQ